MKPRLHVVAIGGSHQFAHFLPVAFELARRRTMDVTIFVTNREEQREVAYFAEEMGVLPPRTVSMMDRFKRASCLVPAKLKKLILLLTWSRRLRGCDAILCAERTSTILKRLPGQCPPLFHIPHGVGDRAIGFEGRFRLFDRVIVAGPKDRDRLIAEGVVRPDACVVGGAIKVASVLQRNASDKALFTSDRPVILYNPHFDKALSSAGAFTRRLVEAVTIDGRFNLILAPHIRLAQNCSKQQRREWEGLAIADRVLVDLGSCRSIDMTYTLAANLYVGDVSSQIYEFLIHPRPCLFVNAHSAAWEDSESYAMWKLGEVISPNCDIPAAIDRAFIHHEKYRPTQIARVSAAFHGLDWSATDRPQFQHQNPISMSADMISMWLSGNPTYCRSSARSVYGARS